jgi:hypothetical protein
MGGQAVVLAEKIFSGGFGEILVKSAKKADF